MESDKRETVTTLVYTLRRRRSRLLSDLFGSHAEDVTSVYLERDQTAGPIRIAALTGDGTELVEWISFGYARRLVTELRNLC